MSTANMNSLWDAFRGRYGTAWAEPDNAKGAWADQLANYSTEEIGDAFKKASQFYRKHPPTLSQFAEIARDLKFAGPPATPPQIEDKRGGLAGNEEGRQWIEDLKAYLAGKSKPMTDAARAYHLKVLSLDPDSVRRKANSTAKWGSEGSCAYPGCQNPGAITHGTGGSSDWYCGKHFRT